MPCSVWYCVPADNHVQHSVDITQAPVTMGFCGLKAATNEAQEILHAGRKKKGGGKGLQAKGNQMM